MQDNNQFNPIQDDNQSQGVNPMGANPVMSFIPKIQPTASQQVSVGGAESGGATIKVESGPTRYEQVDAKTPELEIIKEDVEKIEKKEIKPDPQANPLVAQNQQSASTLPVDTKNLKDQFMLKFSGQKIDESLYKDPDAVKESAGKGDPNLTRTAIQLFLLRLINKVAK